MIAIIWSVFAFLLISWTAVAWATAALTSWGAKAMTATGGVELLGSSGAASLPQWITAWMSPEALEAFVQTARFSAGIIEAALPWAGTAAGWLVPIIWIGWFLVALVMTVVAVVVHKVVR